MKMIFRHIVSLSGKTVYFMVKFAKQEVREIFLNWKELSLLHVVRHLVQKRNCRRNICLLKITVHFIMWSATIASAEMLYFAM
jgi:hypothetical protein